MKNNKRLQSLLKIFGSLTALGMLGIIVTVTMLEFTLPDVQTLKDANLQEPLRIFTRDNQLMAEFGFIRRNPISLDQVSEQFIEATLAIEDQRFFSHTGVDIIGLARAASVLFFTGEKRQGGSTITMQVARNYFLTREKTYSRKLREILLALKIDHVFSKKKILELYFNKVFYGHRAYGIAAAAQIYYNKKIEELTLPQIAMLAGLPKAPSVLNPLSNPVAAKKRRNRVLHRMFELHYIDQTSYEEAIIAPVTAKYYGIKMAVKAPYVAEMVRRVMVNQFGKDVYSQGYSVYTTIDSKTQHAANYALDKALIEYDHRHGYRGAEQHFDVMNIENIDSYIQALEKIPTINGLQPALVTALPEKSAIALLKNGDVITIPWQGLAWARSQITSNNQEYLGRRPNKSSDILKVGDVIRVAQKSNNTWTLTQIPEAEAAIIALNPENGAMLALEGGFNYYKSKFNRVTQAFRQPGSAFKPFIYSAALAKNFTLSTIINDAPVVMRDSGESALWRPENDNEEFYGPTRLRDGLTHSRNLVSIRLLQLIGPRYAVNYATRFGFTRDQMTPSLSFALGTAMVTPLQLATGYAVFANGGYLIKPYFIDQIVDPKHNTIFQAKPLLADKTLSNDEDDKENIKDLLNETSKAPQAITPQNAYLITSALKDVIQHGTGQGALILHRKDLAGKTGTTNQKHDVWFSGFNNNIVGTVWMGYDKPRPLYEYAAHSALPMWIDFMRLALKGEPQASMPQPPGIVTARINRSTGQLASPSDDDAIFEVFRKNLAPKNRAHAVQSNSSNDPDQLY